jgi:hypothetical protein
MDEEWLKRLADMLGKKLPVENEITVIRTIVDPPDWSDRPRMDYSALKDPVLAFEPEELKPTKPVKRPADAPDAEENDDGWAVRGYSRHKPLKINGR